MQIEIIAFGIAKDIINHRSLNIEVKKGISIAELKALLLEQYPAFHKVVSLSFAVNEDYQEDDYTLSAGEKIVIIPPVSGG